jgi:hypothetical protein
LRENAITHIRRLFSGQALDRLRFADFIRQNRERAGLIAEVMASVFRDMLFYGKTSPVNLDCAEMCAGGAKYFTQLELSCIIEHIQEFNKALYTNVNFALLSDMLLLNITEVKHAV